MSIYLIFGEILDYPGRSMQALIDECAAELALECLGAVEPLEMFRDITSGKPLGILEELYTNAFDLRPDCTPNLGYHMFGDDSRRGVFLAELKERMGQAGMAVGVELPDHLSLILRYMDAQEAERPVLIEDCLIPALTKMGEVIEKSENPYRYVVRALLLWLCQKNEEYAQTADVMEV